VNGKRRAASGRKRMGTVGLANAVGPPAPNREVRNGIRRRKGGLYRPQ